MSITVVEVIMPTPARRAVCELCTGQDAHALLRTVRQAGQPPALVRNTPAHQAEKLLEGKHKGTYAHLDKVEFVKAHVSCFPTGAAILADAAD